MGNEYYGINYGDQGYVTVGTATVSKDVELKVNLTGMSQMALMDAVERIVRKITNDSNTNH